MKIFILLFILLSNITFGQLIKVNNTGLTFVTDSITNKLIIPFEFDAFVSETMDGISFDQDWFIKNNGKYINPPLQFDSLLVLEKDQMWACFTTSGRKKIDFIYYNPFYFFKNASCIGTYINDDPSFHENYDDFDSEASVFGILTNTDSIIAYFESLRDYSGNVFLMHKMDSDKYGVLNCNLDTLLDFEYTCTSWDNKNFSFTNLGYLALKNEKNKCGIINNFGKIILPFEYDYIDNPHFDFNLIIRDKKEGLINQNLKIIFPLIYNQIRWSYSYSDPISIVANGKNESIVLDSLFQPWCNFQFEYVGDLDMYQPGVTIVKKNMKFGLFNFGTKQFTLAPEYDSIQKYIFDDTIYYILKKQNKFNLININYEILNSIEGDSIKQFNKENYYILIHHHKQILTDIKLKKYPGEYDKFHSLTQRKEINYFLVENEQKYGIMDQNGKLIIPFIYDNAYKYFYSFEGNNLNFNLILDNTLYIINEKGEVVNKGPINPYATLMKK